MKGLLKSRRLLFQEALQSNCLIIQEIVKGSQFESLFTSHEPQNINNISFLSYPELSVSII